VFESFLQVVGFALPTTQDRQLMGEMVYNCGGTVMRVRRTRRHGEETHYQIVAGDPKNRRIHGLSGLEINANRTATDPYRTVTSWGSRPHQQGDSNYLIGTGPAATDVFEGVNADSLGNRIIGTAFNCSGARSPWGTVLSAEENFQGSATFFIGVQEHVLPNGSQTGYIPGTSGTEFGLVGEKYGWMVEIDPRNPESRGKKHTALGRFRHENVAMRVKRGKPLVLYLGDDRRGGHTWKYVSRASVTHPRDPVNSALLTDGTLYVAKFRADGTGAWIPLTLDNDAANDLVGVFGNNWMFYVPTIGPQAGQVVPFAYGPPRCEMTGPTFVGDTLFLSVQHPGENSLPNDGTPASTLNRELELLALNGSTFTQNRTVPRGSNWPSNIGGKPLGPPKPATIGIRHVNGGPFIPGEDFE
jgi:secreted PhoX family phosphatase